MLRLNTLHYSIVAFCPISQIDHLPRRVTTRERACMCIVIAVLTTRLAQIQALPILRTCPHLPLQLAQIQALPILRTCPHLPLQWRAWVSKDLRLDFSEGTTATLDLLHISSRRCGNSRSLQVWETCYHPLRQITCDADLRTTILVDLARTQTSILCNTPHYSDPTSLCYVTVNFFFWSTECNNSARCIRSTKIPCTCVTEIKGLLYRLLLIVHVDMLFSLMRPIKLWEITAHGWLSL